jgi:hypothetical protein
MGEADVSEKPTIETETISAVQCAEWLELERLPYMTIAAAYLRAHADLHERAAELEKENTVIRAALATSKDPCVYCQLPAAEMAKCRAGFPGCARMDDISGCPEFSRARR